jgi:hypothetical protein
VEPRGGSAEMQLFGDGDEVSKVAEFHGRSRSIYP